MASIKKDFTKGVFWIGLANYSGIVIQLLVSAVLARKIAPAAFGTIAVAMVILHFLNILADIGIGTAVVQYKQLTKEHLNSLFTLTVYFALILSLVLYSLASVIANYYSDETLVLVCQIMSLVIFFNSLNVVPNGLMRKEKRFRTIALRTLFFQIISGSIAVWGALRGWGIYALLVSPVLSSIGVFCVNFYNYPHRFLIRMSSEAIKMVSSFSLYQFAFAFCNYFSRNLDKLIIGKYFSLTQLGYYDKSYHLMMLPVQKLSYVISPVLHPILSDLQNDKHALKEKNCRLSVAIANISFPIGLILFFCSGELIRIVYGCRWDAAVPVFRILALSLPLQMILSTNNPIFQAAGKTNLLFFSGILNTSCTVTGFLLAVWHFKSLEAVAWSWDITLTINFVNTYYILHRFALKEEYYSYYKSLSPQLLNTVLTFVILTMVTHFIQEKNIIITLLLKLFFISFLTVSFASLLGQYKLKDIAKPISVAFKK